MLAHLGGYVAPSWPILRPMLAHVGPSSAIRSEKWQKMGRAQNTVKRGSFWPDRVVCGWGGGPSLLRRGEKRRTAMPRPGGPWPDLRAAAPAADPGQKKRFAGEESLSVYRSLVVPSPAVSFPSSIASTMTLGGPLHHVERFSVKFPGTL